MDGEHCELGPPLPHFFLVSCTNRRPRLKLVLGALASGQLCNDTNLDQPTDAGM